MSKEYIISDDSIKKRKLVMLLMTIALPILMVFFAFILAGKMDLKERSLFVKIMSGITVFIIVEMLVITKIMIKKIRSTTIIMTENGLERHGGKHIEVFNFSEITKVQVIRLPSTKIEYIKLKVGKKAFNIYGFESMNEIINVIKNKVKDIELVTEKQWKFDWNGPFGTIVSIVITTIVITIIMKFDLNVYDAFNKIFMTLFALYFLIGKPISKNAGKRFRVLELSLGSIMIVANMMSIIGSILG